jgi:hypothetical protein
MRLTVRLISSSCLVLMLAACATSPPASKSKTKNLPRPIYQKVFYFPYDNVWRAAQLALKYPISVNNMDHGILETDSIKADDGFAPPGGERSPSSGVRYKISMILAKGKVEGREGIRVTINKNIEKKRDFFSEAEVLPTDGLEEKVIFYRMERELIIDEALKKAAKASN